MSPVDTTFATSDDRTTALALVDKYRLSLMTSDLPTLQSCFHEQATIFTNFDNQLQGGPIAWLYDRVKQNDAVTSFESEIDLLSITPVTAVAQVKLYCENPAYEVSDFLSMVKKPDGAWTIVSSIFQVY